MRKLSTLLTLLLAGALSGPVVAQIHSASFRSHDASLKLWCEGDKIGALFVNVSKLKYYSVWDMQAVDELKPRMRINVDDLPTIEVGVTVGLARNSLLAEGDSDMNLITTVRKARNRITVSLDLPRGIGLERSFDVQAAAEQVGAMIEGCGLGD